jgi:hypothetical protein
MTLNFIKKYRVLAIGFSIAFLFAACGEAPQPTPTAVPLTSIPSTSTSQPTFTPQPTSTPEPTLTPLPEIELNIELPEGDPEKGFLTAIRYGCQGCHANDDHPENAPRFVAHDDLPNIFERGEVRIASPEYKGRATTNYEYIIESILLPEAYFVSGKWPDTMSTFTIDIIEVQELADIIAWMEKLE